MKVLGGKSGIIFQNLHEILSDTMVSVYFLDMFLLLFLVIIENNLV